MIGTCPHGESLGQECVRCGAVSAGTSVEFHMTTTGPLLCTGCEYSPDGLVTLTESAWVWWAWPPAARTPTTGECRTKLAAIDAVQSLLSVKETQ